MDQHFTLLLDIKQTLGTLAEKIEGLRVDVQGHEHKVTKNRDRIESLERSRSKMHGIVLTIGAVSGAVAAKTLQFLGIQT